MSSDVKGERLKLHCRVVEEGKAADAAEKARGCQAVASSRPRSCHTWEPD